MEFEFVSVEFCAIQKAVQEHLTQLPKAIDSFLEDHILASKHYALQRAGESVGFASIHESSLITQFSLQDSVKRYGPSLFQRLRLLEMVRSAFVPTCDEFYLSNALEGYSHLAKQAYFFFACANSGDFPTQEFSLRLAQPEDKDLIQRHSGDFFDNLETRIGEGEIFLTLRERECVGFGIAVRSKIYTAVASIGMFTIPEYRNGGVGTATIRLLMQECGRREVQAVAGCWYYNHLSKKTLERAGMFSQTRLLRIEY